MTPKLAEVEERGQHTYNKTTHILRQSLSRYPKGQQAAGGDGKVETEGSAVGYDCGDDPNRAFDELMRCARTAHQELHNKINPGTVSYCNTPEQRYNDVVWCGAALHVKIDLGKLCYRNGIHSHKPIYTPHVHR